jgi:hypothetical protein
VVFTRLKWLHCLKGCPMIDGKSSCMARPIARLLPWRMVIDRRFHRLIYLFGREEHGRLHTGRAG